MADHQSTVDAKTGVSTTGHEWDDIRELNNPLPRWWLWVFYVTIVWSVLYWVVYPAWPLITSQTNGIFGWNSRAAVVEELSALQSKRAELGTKLAAASVKDIENDPKLLSFARAWAKPMFAENCGPCHGQGAQGAKGYPNLNDDDWVWGGTAEAIEQTIRYGIRNENGQSRQGNMPAFGRDGLIAKADIPAIADYVRSLSGLPTEKGIDLAKGAKLFAENCASCHGEKGEGNQDMGALNLTDQIWLYGSDRATIMEGIQNGRGGVMPAWANRLDDTTIKALTVYVHTLGGGK